MGVDGLVTVPDVATGTALILVDPDGQNEIGVALGANDRLTVDMASGHEASIAWADVPLLSAGDTAARRPLGPGVREAPQRDDHSQSGALLPAER